MLDPSTDEAREMAKKRAERFGIALVDRPAKPGTSHFIMRPCKPTLIADDGSAPVRVSATLAKAQPGMEEDGGAGDAGFDGFVTGFDIHDEEEQKKIAARAARFGAPPPGSDEVPKEEIKDESEEMLSREMREKRAQRFSIPVGEDFAIATRAADVQRKMRVNIRHPDLVFESKREEALHVFGPFDNQLTEDVSRWFSEYGPKHVEWIHGNALNVAFADKYSAKRALMSMCAAVPAVAGVEGSDIIAEREWRLGSFECTINGVKRENDFLVRGATDSDLKPDKPPPGSNTNWRKYERGRRGRHNRRRQGRHQPYARRDDDDAMSDGDSQRRRRGRRGRRGRREGGSEFAAPAAPAAVEDRLSMGLSSSR